MHDEKSELTKKRDEEMTNRILIVFCVGLLTLLSVMFLYRLMLTPKIMFAIQKGSFAVGLVFGVLGVAAVVLAAFTQRKKTAGFWAGRLSVLSVICFVYMGSLLLIHYRTFEAFKILYVAIPVLAFLYLVYNIYQRDFFWQTLVVGCSGAVLYAFSRWLHYKPWQPIVHIVYITAIAMLIAGLAATFIVQRNNGRIFGWKVFSKGANYRLMLMTFGLMILTIAAVLVIGSSVAFWTMIGVFAYLFVLAVYYTIRLM